MQSRPKRWFLHGMLQWIRVDKFMQCRGAYTSTLGLALQLVLNQNIFAAFEIVWPAMIRQIFDSLSFLSIDVDAIRIPMAGVSDSLNVSVAAAVILFEARRQRHNS